MVNRYLSTLLLFVAVQFFPSTANAIPGIAGGDEMEDTTVSDLTPDNTKSVDELIEEARDLLRSGRPIDARAKMLLAVQKAPNDFRPYMLLSQYYLFEVAHFTLAYRYVMTAEKHFTQQYGSDQTGTLEDVAIPDHAMLLYLRSEAELNLDKYQESLNTLERFEKRYWLDWFPGTKAWVLMKLKRIDEAISVAQNGLAREADPRRTWNILGILLSLKGNRELSLHAFREAIKAELSLRGSGMIATPLNNAGEVYRELFQDLNSESAFLRALRLPDGCEHVLPSLNLAHMYIDQLRLFQAERVLRDFENCFQQQSLRHDSEHRTLLALARGKIAMHSNRINDALPLVQLAVDDQQWFGKIGTNENDVKFAGAVTLAMALEAEAAVLRDRAYDSLWEKVLALGKAELNEVRAWWLYRKGVRIGIEQLDDLEDLFVRHTDSMLQYPTLGSALRHLDTRSVAKRIERMIAEDRRPPAHTHYRLYLAENLLDHGDEEGAIALLEQVLAEVRPIDRLVRAQALALYIVAKDSTQSWWSGLSELSIKLRHELFELLPSHLRYHDIALPVRLTLAPSNQDERGLLEDIAGTLTAKRFTIAPKDATDIRYSLVLSSTALGQEAGKKSISIQLMDSQTSGQRSYATATIESNGTGSAALINDFVDKVFAHQLDPQSDPVPSLPLLEGVM